jgi:hypothetical protein
LKRPPSISTPRCATRISNGGNGPSRRGCASPRRCCRVSQAVTRLARLTPGSQRRHRAAKGGGLAGSAHGLPAACAVDRRRGGRTQDEDAVDQAFSAALPDVQDRGATRERGSGARPWSMVRFAVACGRRCVPSRRAPAACRWRHAAGHSVDVPRLKASTMPVAVSGVSGLGPGPQRGCGTWFAACRVAGGLSSVGDDG